MTHRSRLSPARTLLVLAMVGLAVLAASQEKTLSIERAVTGQDPGKTPEISTQELRLILVSGSATVFDARPPAEYGMGHIPGARNVAPKPGAPTSEYVSDAAEIGRVVNGNKKAPIVLYCNGPFCGKSKRLADELATAGFTNVRRYQLGIPVWRALGGPCEMSFQAFFDILQKDKTAVVIDAREADAFRALSLPGSRNIPRSLVQEGKDVGEIKKAKDDGRLPMDDHNTRIIVIASDGASARYVAGALTYEAFQNVNYLEGSFAQTKAAGDSLSK
ncbi:MAG TPA: rhodanese-like domain-containing protein [Candidatus Eisenbacteria bacterium]|nr:rhodanese-like domain-containing protein [Candidatus Eisenbacteria bacterium]